MLLDKSESELRQMLTNFCQRYSYVNRIAQKAREEVDRVAAPRFSVFNLFKYDEMALSRIIADLLRPDGSHGQGQLFLELFIRRINDELLADKPLETTSLENATAATEVITSHIERSQRRIDIVVANPPHWVLGIENKPWAWEQEKQLEDYQKQLNNRYSATLRTHIIYLSGTCSKTDTADPKQPPLYLGYSRNEARCGKDHAHLVDWLEECAQKCHVEKVRHFLLDFAQWAQREFVKQVETKEIRRSEA